VQTSLVESILQRALKKGFGVPNCGRVEGLIPTAIKLLIFPSEQLRTSFP
jgi:hypothetical protein